tara:strand:+ start:8245 stop:8583 length:339 start_codon:yes stop_codon:yes gene_type:complete
MNANRMKILTEALRSGRFKQSQDPEILNERCDDPEQCCVGGVVLNLLQDYGLTRKPICARKWLGMSEAEISRFAAWTSQMNLLKTFDEIADLIDDEVQKQTTDSGFAMVWRP